MERASRASVPGTARRISPPSLLASEVDVPIIVVGGLRSRETMQRILDETGIELLSLSRPLLFDPAFPRKLESGEVDASRCVSCNGCYSSFQHRCVFRR